jgi:hypothetical protein
MLNALLLLALPTIAAPHAMPEVTKDPPVRVWFNSKGDYDYGDRAKVYAKSAQGGYLIVLRSDAAGRVRVLFPLEPGSDQQITGGKKYELKGRGGREAFVADDSGGHGTVLAAISESPFQVDRFSQGGHWNLQALSTPRVKEDSESGLLALVDSMRSPSARFEYDVATYIVSPRYARDRDLYGYPYPGYGWWGYDPWWGSRIGLGFSWRPRGFYRFDGWRHR